MPERNNNTHRQPSAHTTDAGEAAKRTHMVILCCRRALLYYRLSRIGILPTPHECDDCSLDNATANLDYLTQKDKSYLQVSTADLAARYIYVKEDVEEIARQLVPSQREEALGVATEQPYTLSLLDNLDVLVGKDAWRTVKKGARAYQCSVELPKGSLRQITPRLYIVSPELMFVQMSYQLQEPHLVAALATELAGTYALLPTGMTSCERLLRNKKPLFDSSYLKGDGYCDALPLTTIGKLQKFLENVSHLRGSGPASKGLQAAVDNSASPFETELDVSLILRRSWGGAGCGTAKANENIPFNEEGRKITNKRKAIADVIFTAKNGKRIVIEPGGEEWHSGKNAMVNDNARRLALENQRIEVIVVPWKTFENPDSWMLICKRVACHLGKNFHTPSKKMIARWNHVHKDFCNKDLLKEAF